MPLTELMHYFNDQLQTQARTKSLPKTGFYKVENGYWARFGSLTLGSQFHNIHQTVQGTNGVENSIGQYSNLIVRSGTGKSLCIDEIFNSLDNTNEIVHLDRLTRTLHSLNYLQQFDGQKGLLALAVQPRHIVSVAAEHGKTFEAILSDCGLGPERVLLHTRLLDHHSLPHFRNALLSYRSRGYQLGITLEKPQDILLLDELALSPDVIFYNYSEPNEQSISPIHLVNHQKSRHILVSSNTKTYTETLTEKSIFNGCLHLPLSTISTDGFSHHIDG